MVMDNGPKFFEIVDRHPNVRAVVWGHVHQEFSGERNGMKLIGTPSTCLQFRPASPVFSLDAAPPGFRWFRLHDDGRVETGVERIKNFKMSPDLSAKGY